MVGLPLGTEVWLVHTGLAGRGVGRAGGGCADGIGNSKGVGLVVLGGWPPLGERPAGQSGVAWGAIGGVARVERAEGRGVPRERGSKRRRSAHTTRGYGGRKGFKYRDRATRKSRWVPGMAGYHLALY